MMSIRQYYKHEGVEGCKVGRFDLGINTQFIVYRMGDTVFDAGPSNQWRYVKRFLTQSPVRQLLLTHHHEDHSGNAQRIAKHFKVLPKAPKLSQKKLADGYPTPMVQKIIWGNPKKTKSQPLEESEFLSDNSPIQPVHTPGHAKDLTCYFLPKQGYFFSGDLFIARNLKLLRSDEDLPLLIDSLRKAVALDFETMFCPHGGIFTNGKEMLNTKLNNILALCEQAQTLSKEGFEIGQITLKLLGEEGAVGKLSGGNFSKLNMIKECLRVTV
jgi:glyoxylase-like metal-dependent hydrolase (beta-lactamase superfamily II)